MVVNYQESAAAKHPLVYLAYIDKEDQNEPGEPFVACFGDLSKLEEFQKWSWKKEYSVSYEWVKIIDSDTVPPEGTNVYLVFDAWFDPRLDKVYWNASQVGMAAALSKEAADKYYEAKKGKSGAEIVVERKLGWIYPEIDRFLTCLKPQAN